MQLSTICIHAYSHVGGNNSMYKDMYAQYLKIPFLVQICRQLKDVPSAILGSAPASSNISETSTFCLLQVSCRGVAPSSPYIQDIYIYSIYNIIYMMYKYMKYLKEICEKDEGMAHF